MALTDPVEFLVEKYYSTLMFFLIETSNSMAGCRIETINNVMKSVIPEISEKIYNFDVKIAALAFSSGARWLTDAPVSAENFDWKELKAEGNTDLGSAYKSLHEKIVKDAMMKKYCGSFSPSIILIGNGNPTDEWKSSLAALKQTPWFKSSYKLAFAIGDNANTDVLTEFTGTSNSVYRFDSFGKNLENEREYLSTIEDIINSFCYKVYIVDDYNPSQLDAIDEAYGVIRDYDD
ncbi:MAG: hypothetical protein FWB95_07510 [Treponema sp.]|nr:hypothetical protein [Treponema sp.]